MLFGHAEACCAGGGGMVRVRAAAFCWHAGLLKQGQLLLPSLEESYTGINGSAGMSTLPFIAAEEIDEKIGLFLTTTKKRI